MPGSKPPGRHRNFDDRLFENPLGKFRDFDIGFLRRRMRNVEQSAVGFVASKLRTDDGNIDVPSPAAFDVVHRELVLPPGAPDTLARPSALWMAVDRNVWEADQDLAVVYTFWFPRARSVHLCHRAARDFVQLVICDEWGVAGHVITHVPAERGKGGDVHSHVICTARAVGSIGLGRFVRPLLEDAGQALIHRAWHDWLDQRASALRP